MCAPCQVWRNPAPEATTGSWPLYGEEQCPGQDRDNGGGVLCQLRLGQPEYLPTEAKEIENISMPRATLAPGGVIKYVHSS